jgi:hypothetical protein
MVNNASQPRVDNAQLARLAFMLLVFAAFIAYQCLK